MTQRLVFCAARRGAGALPPMAVEECTVSIRRRLSSCVQPLGVSVAAAGWRVASRMYSTDSSPPSTTSETDELFAMMEQEEAFVPVSNDEGGMRVPYQSKSARRTQPDGEVIASAMKEYQASALRHEANKNDESGSNAAQNGQQQQQVDEWRPRFRTLRLNGMPRYWMHEDIVKFVDLVAEQAEIPTPAVAEEEESWNSHGDASPSNSAVPVARSPFIARLKVPYGRRTGLLYGSPEIEIKSSRLADHLLKRLVFEPDDYRSRISFSEVPLHELKRRWDAQEEKRARLRLMSQNLHSGEDGSGTSATDASEDWMLSEEEELKLEQQYVLETLELDRYLLAPDLLYDLAKMQQRRLITRSGKVILPTFRDTYDEKDAVASEIGMNEEPPAASPRRKRSSSGRKRVKTSVRADDNPELGRGSPQNMPIQKPYVHGRPGL